MTSEFALLAEIADEIGRTEPLPQVTRVDADVAGQRVSALAWTPASPRVVLLHGGGQNAHTWDTMMLHLDVPALAVDLPGHGHSSWRDDHDYRPHVSADTLLPVLRELAPDADLVVGMSLGGLTTLRIAAIAPDSVPRAVLVDVTPESPRRAADLTAAARGTVALIEGPQEFSTLEEIVDLTAAASPNRSRASVRRGVIHNTRQRDDGAWVWRYDRIREAPDPAPMWDDLAAVQAPLTLVEGGRSPFTTDDDIARLRRVQPSAQVITVADAGHSVQSDAPDQLAEIIRRQLD